MCTVLLLEVVWGIDAFLSYRKKIVKMKISHLNWSFKSWIYIDPSKYYFIILVLRIGFYKIILLFRLDIYCISFELQPFFRCFIWFCIHSKCMLSWRFCMDWALSYRVSTINKLYNSARKMLASFILLIL